MTITMFWIEDASGLRNVVQVEAMQNEIQMNLDDHVNNRHCEIRGRFGRLLLLGCRLKNLSKAMIQQVHALRIFGVPVDDLLHELLLEGEYFENIDI